MKIKFRWLLLAVLCAAWVGNFASPVVQGAEPSLTNAKVEKGTDVRAFVIILDCSGSMKDAIEGEGEGSKFAAAQRATIELINSIPDGRQVALVIYGHDIQLDCQAVSTIRQLTPIDAEGKAELQKAIQALEPLGNTPIALSLQLAADQLMATKEMSKVVLISDGMETCGGDPTEEARLMSEKFAYLAGGVDVIGFGLMAEESQALSRIAAAGKGKFYDAQSAKQLLASVQEVRSDVVEDQPQPQPQPLPQPQLSLIDQALIAKLKDPDLNVRTQAAMALQKRKVAAAVPHLIQLLTHDDWDNYAGEVLSRNAAYEALKVLAPEVLEQALIDATNATDANVKAWATEKLGE